MAGLYSALNIAKNALLAFQTGVHVTGHNVANVDTEGYSRQKVVNAPYPPTPGPAGPMGSGVKVEQIKRYFDAFLEANINLKKSDLGLLSAEETGLDMVQGLFNETNPLGLSKLLEDFFSAWQGLSNRAEGIPERRVVIEKGRVLAEAVQDKYQGLVDLEGNVRLKVKDVVEEINELAKQIAEINRQITAAESGLHQANDLRDQRDRLVAKLSQLAEIRYFENSQGAYAVILGKGYNLVDIDSYWQLELSGGEVYWQGHNGEKVRLTSAEVARGELGGWLRILEQVSDEWNYEYVISTRSAFTKDGRIVRENTTFEELGLSGTISVSFKGTNHFGEEVSGTFTTTDNTKTIRDFLNEVEKAFDYKVQAYLTKDGRLVVRDAVRGGGKLSFAITTAPFDFGRFDDEAANHRVEELNLTGKFQLFAEELIRAVNEIHTEGVGLKFFEGELEGRFHTEGAIKGLPFFRDIKGDGSLFIWLKSPTGQITPVKVDFQLPPTATLFDVEEQINRAIESLDFDTNQTVKALVRDGRLVFQAQEGWGFAFSNDSARILLATGVNVFFEGYDAGSISLNDQLSVNPEYLAAARLDREAWRSQVPLAGSYRSRLPVKNPEAVVFNDPPHRLYVRFFDKNGRQVLHETEDGFKAQELSVAVEPGDTLEDILSKLDALEGLRAYLDGEGHLVLELDPNYSGNYAYFELGAEAPPPADSFLSFLREQGVWAPQYIAARGRQESTRWFDDPTAVSLNEGADLTLNLVFYDAEGRETGRTNLTVADGTSVKELAEALNALPEIRAGFSEGDQGLFYLSLDEAPPGSVSFTLTVSGGDGDGSLDLSSGTLAFAPVGDRQVFSGLEPVFKPTQYETDLGPQDPQNLAFSGWLNIRFFDRGGNELKSASLATYGTPDVTLTDGNGNGYVDLEDLIRALDSLPGLKAYIDNGELVVALDEGAPEGTSYFVIEGNDPLRSWGTLTLRNLAGPGPEDDSYYRLSFRIGALENWLYDKNGDPIDADPNNSVVDPFRVELTTDRGIIQILEKYNAEENARFGLSAGLDTEGRLVVELSGLYDTKSFVLTDSFARKAFEAKISANRFRGDPENRWFLMTDAPVADEDLFFSAPDDNTTTSPTALQFLTLSYQDADQNEVKKEHIFVRRSDASFTSADAFTLTDSSATVEITFYDAEGNALGSPESITLSSGTTLAEAAAALDGLSGLHAAVTDDGHLLLSLRATEFPDAGDDRRQAAFFTVSVDDDNDDRLTFSDGSTTSSITFTGSVRFKDYRQEIEGLDVDRDGLADFSTALDASGRFSLLVNDPDLNGDGAPDWSRFSLASSYSEEEGNLGVYLSRRVYYAKKGLFSELQGFEPQPGDNRNALRLSELSGASREVLGEANLYDYYTSLVGEVGIATKTVKNSKTFMEDLINQLQIMRDSVSGVSLDEEMANLIKYQQAFAASAKILTVTDEMLDKLIEAKR